ncbi:Pvc16 family protein [Catellatospora chokoriensis]|uniref:Pvc16 N-terminal domain-containing protein n=1 Tax=Catellatospora chokoriensis TaxID=310353 RepID=A0A8J3NRP1_9ACTN|nr:Pvc16 family protein [Catellatospora chokoriensis]GIF90387.1 hypothetical protein Cch02nite_38310 [Catellatospora chokoriensis]
MSNVLSIAAVTSTLRFLLTRALTCELPGPVGGAKVTTLRPDRLHDSTDTENGSAGINIYLYQIGDNHAHGRRDLPTRRADGSLAARPCATLDLHYLITCYGDDAKLESQRLLARTVTELARTPVLAAKLVRRALRAYGTAGSDLEFLADADLADAPEPVKLSPALLSLEELSKLWSVYFQASYLLSVAYVASVVVLEAPDMPSVALPVRHRELDVRSSPGPRLLSAEAADGTGRTLRLRGIDLHATRTVAQVGPARLAAEPAEQGTLVVAVEGHVPAGAHTVQVLHLDAPLPHRPEPVAAASNTVAALIRPHLRAVEVVDEDVRLRLSPPLWAGQQASVQLSCIAGACADRADQLLVLPLDAPEPGAAPRDVVNIARSAVPDGTWLVQVQVDGVVSVPQTVDGVYAAPALTLPPP